MKRFRGLHGWSLIAGLILCLTVSCNAAEPKISDILASPAQFDGKTVTVRGMAAAVKETTSRKGNDYTTFRVQDSGGAPIVIFTFGHLGIRNADCVLVIGVFEKVKNVGPYTFYDEIEAQRVAPSTC